MIKEKITEKLVLPQSIPLPIWRCYLGEQCIYLFPVYQPRNEGKIFLPMPLDKNFAGPSGFLKK